MGYGILLLAYSNQNYLLLLFTPGICLACLSVSMSVCATSNLEIYDVIYLLTITSCLL